MGRDEGKGRGTGTKQGTAELGWREARWGRMELTTSNGKGGPAGGMTGGLGGGQPSPIIAVFIFFLYSRSESLHASENNLEVMLPETIMSDVAPPVPDWSLIGSHPT